MSFQFRFKFPTLALGLCLFFFSHAFSTVAMAAQEEPLQGSANISSYQLSPQKPLTLTLNLHLPEGYHAYADKFKLEIEEPEGFSYHNIQTEPLVQFYDEVTKKKKM